MKTLIVNDKFDNKKLLSFLTFHYPNASVNTFYKALRKKDIRINDIKVSENLIVHKGDCIKIYVIDDLLFNIDINFDILYQDVNILVVNKPKGIEVIRKFKLLNFYFAV